LLFNTTEILFTVIIKLNKIKKHFHFLLHKKLSLIQIIQLHITQHPHSNSALSFKSLNINATIKLFTYLAINQPIKSYSNQHIKTHQLDSKSNQSKTITH